MPVDVAEGASPPHIALDTSDDDEVMEDVVCAGDEDSPMGNAETNSGSEKESGCSKDDYAHPTSGMTFPSSVDSCTALNEARTHLKAAAAFIVSPKHVVRSLLRGSDVHRAEEASHYAHAFNENRTIHSSTILKYPEASVRSAMVLVPELRLFLAEQKLEKGNILMVGEESGCHVNYLAKAFPGWCSLCSGGHFCRARIQRGLFSARTGNDPL